MNGWEIRQIDSLMKDFWESVQVLRGQSVMFPISNLEQSIFVIGQIQDCDFRKTPDVSEQFCYFCCEILRADFSSSLQFDPLHQDSSTKACLLKPIFSLKWVNVFHRTAVMDLGLILAQPPANREASEKPWSFLWLCLSIDDTVLLGVHGCPLNFKFPIRGRVDIA